ncbi:beta-carotene ketolase [Synechococcales cyanobacterium C]|uniref:Beta-carotene ketolase n=1 Tax=Petrachloros mirabilis ULC683 TaxID=2781853 RepID=A0A8K2AA08_9CYAN|nr:fatty acid desaturase [Petrachloros mirabilis]NCJ08755.1 beta-carotene ketolase [Petrachloros mirabilis ULC683]
MITLELRGKSEPGSDWLGIGGAIALLSLWSITLLAGLQWTDWEWGGLLVAVWARTFLHTGLFVIGHDAMHRSLCPRYPWWNNFIGQIAVGLYACLPFGDCCRKHWAHHRHPGRKDDPDFHPGRTAHPLGWYLRFLRTYLTLAQLWRLGLQWGVLLALSCGLSLYSPVNLWWFWILPFFLSSVQLFIFGTYLPHHPQAQSHANGHHATSSYYPLLWSFLSCYHFGYHWEHHEYPQVPWYRLPLLVKSNRRFRFL